MPQIEEDFVCGRCKGEIIPIGSDEETGLLIFECGVCHSGNQFECPICHKPRTIFIHGRCHFCSQINLKKIFQMALNREMN
jgi:hypothetical protein